MSGRSSYSWGSAAHFFLARVDQKSLFLAEVDHERYFFILYSLKSIQTKQHKTNQKH